MRNEFRPSRQVFLIFSSKIEPENRRMIFFQNISKARATFRSAELTSQRKVNQFRKKLLLHFFFFTVVKCESGTAVSRKNSTDSFVSAFLPSTTKRDRNVVTNHRVNWEKYPLVIAIERQLERTAGTEDAESSSQCYFFLTRITNISQQLLYVARFRVASLPAVKQNVRVTEIFLLRFLSTRCFVVVVMPNIRSRIFRIGRVMPGRNTCQQNSIIFH